MIVGIFIGTLCLLGLVRTVMGRGHRYAGGWGPHYAGASWGAGAWGGGGCGPREYRSGPFGFGRRGFGDHGRHGARPSAVGVVHTMLERLDASPAQERAILGVVDDVLRTIRERKGDAQQAREDLGRALREPTLDQAAVASARAHVEAATHLIGDALTAALTEIHGILDDRQRRMLGDVIASAWSRW